MAVVGNDGNMLYDSVLPTRIKLCVYNIINPNPASINLAIGIWF
jgi:hypothetical protein